MLERTSLLLFMAEYDRRFYVGPSRVGVGYGAGVHLVREGGFTWDLGVGIGDSRPESRSPLLAGMGDRRAHLFAGTGLHYRYQDYRAGFTVAHGMLDDSGNRATLTLGRTIPVVPRWSLDLGLHGTYADAKAMNYDFGITPAQAANRAALVAAGDASFTAAQIGPYTAPAGMRDLGGLISLNYRPKPRWVWTVSVNGEILLGGVRNSPLVASNDYRGLGIGFTYSF
jgi:outer membrane scaffolding protein for murein synthesis (MipA/OmpV family)